MYVDYTHLANPIGVLVPHLTSFYATKVTKWKRKISKINIYNYNYIRILLFKN